MGDQPGCPCSICDEDVMNKSKNQNLRTRIAAAIYGVQLPWDGHPWQSLTREAQSLYLEQADAVIAELGLRVEFGWLDHEDSGMLYDSLDEARESTHGSGETLRSRLVSDWEDVPEEPDAEEPAEGSGLMERLIMAALDTLAEGDPVLKIGIGNAEIRIGWW